MPCWPRKFWILAGCSVSEHVLGCRSASACQDTYPADDLIVVGEVSLAVLAPVDALGIQVDVVGEAHLEWKMGLPARVMSEMGLLVSVALLERGSRALDSTLAGVGARLAATRSQRGRWAAAGEDSDCA